MSMGQNDVESGEKICYGSGCRAGCCSDMTLYFQNRDEAKNVFPEMREQKTQMDLFGGSKGDVYGLEVNDSRFDVHFRGLCPRNLREEGNFGCELYDSDLFPDTCGIIEVNETKCEKIRRSQGLGKVKMDNPTDIEYTGFKGSVKRVMEFWGNCG